MKRSRNYEINYLNKTVIVTRKFMDAATQMNSNEFSLLTYQMMLDYITMLDDSEEMLEEFKAIRAAAKSRADRTKHVNNWFRQKFPRYDEVPEFDSDYRIVHNPNPAA